MYIYKTGLLQPTEQELEHNRKIWAREFEERFLDFRTPFDLRGDDLPEYHYWGEDQNTQVKPKYMTALQSTHHQDMTEIPRFFPNGM